MSRAERNARSLRRQLVAWLRERVRSTGAGGVVFGLSGGVDSAATCGLCAEAVGSDRCLALILPVHSMPQDAELAARVAEHFGVTAVELDLSSVFDATVVALASARRALDLAPLADAAGRERLAEANLKPRLRMSSLYYFANTLDFLVVGTGNAAERAVGYFTKWGDGAADLAPLGDLTKGEVRALARELSVPGSVIDRPPSAGLWPEQTDEAELGLTYERIDRYLLDGSSGDAAADAEIERRSRLSRHKLEPVPIPHPE